MENRIGSVHCEGVTYIGKITDIDDLTLIDTVQVLALSVDSNKELQVILLRLGETFIYNDDVVISYLDSTSPLYQAYVKFTSNITIATTKQIIGGLS